MTGYEKYIRFCEQNTTLGECEFFDKLAEELQVSRKTALDIWYAHQRSWFEPEMVDELIRLDKAEGEFKPILGTREFVWKDGKFHPLPENV